MSTTLSKRVRREMKLPNIGLQLLYDYTQTKSSATMYLQWCVAKPFLDFVRDNNIKNALVLVTIKNPEEHEVRYVFDLTSPRELIQFHASGTHTIRASVVWSKQHRAKKIRSWLLDKQCGQYRYSLNDLIGGHTNKRRHAMGLRRFGVAERTINVSADFFAPVLSARQEWWINLLFPTYAKNSCSIRRRRFIAYFPLLQPTAVAIWLVLMTLFRFGTAMFYGALCGLRCDWGAIVHPFTQSFVEVWHHKKNKTSWIGRRTDGTERAVGEGGAVLLAPLPHVILLGIATIVLAKNDYDFNFLNYVVAYFATVVFIVAIVAVFAGVATFFENVDDWWRKALDTFMAWWKPDRLEQLQCSAAPIQGLRPVGYTPRLLYQRVQAAYCKPVQS